MWENFTTNQQSTGMGWLQIHDFDYNQNGIHCMENDYDYDYVPPP